MCETHGGNMHGVMVNINDSKKSGGKVTEKYLPYEKGDRI